MSKRVAPLAMIKRLLLRLLLVCVVFWGGGIAVFSVLPVPFSAVMLERRLAPGSPVISIMSPILTGLAWTRFPPGWGWR